MKSGCCCASNVGMIDKLVRLVAGLALFSMLFTVDDSTKWIGLLSIPLLGSAVLGHCMLYKLLNVNTTKLGCCGSKKDAVDGEQKESCGSGGCGCKKD